MRSVSLSLVLLILMPVSLSFLARAQKEEPKGTVKGPRGQELGPATGVVIKGGPPGRRVGQGPEGNPGGNAPKPGGGPNLVMALSATGTMGGKTRPLKSGDTVSEAEVISFSLTVSNVGDQDTVGPKLEIDFAVTGAITQPRTLGFKLFNPIKAKTSVTYEGQSAPRLTAPLGSGGKEIVVNSKVNPNKLIGETTDADNAAPKFTLKIKKR